MSDLTYEEYQELSEKIRKNPQWDEAVSAKARWEGMSRWAVLNQWTCLREPPPEEPGDEWYT